MGYFSHKKKQKRENFTLNVILVIFSLITLSVFFNDENNVLVNLINAWRYQFYILACLVLFFAAFHKKIIYSLCLFVLIFINYMFIASSANLFRNVKVTGFDTIRVVYQNDVRKPLSVVAQASKNNVDIVALNGTKPLVLPQSGLYNNYGSHDKVSKSFIASKLNITKSGRINFTKNRPASFVTFSHGNQNVTFVNLDFSNISTSEQNTVFNNLREFVMDQDGPVIIAGEFGIPSWSNRFKTFLNITGLEVKNKIILSEGFYPFNLFAVPTFNVLSFKNVGINNIEFLDKKSSPKYPLMIDIEIN